jgi:hypothetical protein
MLWERTIRVSKLPCMHNILLQCLNVCDLWDMQGGGPDTDVVYPCFVTISVGGRPLRSPGCGGHWELYRSFEDAVDFVVTSSGAPIWSSSFAKHLNSRCDYAVSLALCAP